MAGYDRVEVNLDTLKGLLETTLRSMQSGMDPKIISDFAASVLDDNLHAVVADVPTLPDDSFDEDLRRSLLQLYILYLLHQGMPDQAVLAAREYQLGIPTDDPFYINGFPSMVVSLLSDSSDLDKIFQDRKNDVLQKLGSFSSNEDDLTILVKSACTAHNFAFFTGQFMSPFPDLIDRLLLQERLPQQYGDAGGQQDVNLQNAEILCEALFITQDEAKAALRAHPVAVEAFRVEVNRLCLNNELYMELLQGLAARLGLPQAEDHAADERLLDLLKIGWSAVDAYSQETRGVLRQLRGSDAFHR